MPARSDDPATPSACLRALVESDAARPRLTSVRADERLDLSGSTLSNWVAKTAHLLRDEVGLAPGDRLGLCLPRHWLAAVWLLAADTVGAGLVVLPAEDGADVPSAALDGLLAPAGGPSPAAVLIGPQRDLEPAVARAAQVGAELLVASLLPFGLPSPVPPPSPARDLATAVRAHPDSPAAVEGDPTLPLLLTAGGSLTRADVQRKARDHAAAAGWPERPRVLATGAVTAENLVTGLLAPWAVRGSAVWAGNLSAAALVSVAEQERTTAHA